MSTDSMMGGLISLPGNLSSPRDAKASEFGSGDYASGPAGQASGQNQLVKQTLTQEGPQHTQDGGSGEPSVWGKADFPVAVSKGEAGSPASSVAWKGNVDLKTGAHS